MGSGVSIRKTATIMQISKSSVHTIVKKFREASGGHFLVTDPVHRSKKPKNEEPIDLDPFFELKYDYVLDETC